MARMPVGYLEEYFTGAATSAVVTTVTRMVENEAVRRLWAIDPSIFTADPDAGKGIPGQMGWLRSAEFLSTELGRIGAFVRQVYHSGVRKVLVLATGAEAHSAKVFLEPLGRNVGFPEVRLLDDSEPESLRQALGWCEPAFTFVLLLGRRELSPELEALEAVVWQALREQLGVAPGARFAAVADPGGALVRLAKQRKYSAIFENPSDITARYSALSYVGLLPAALGGADLEALLRHAHAMSEACAPAVAVEQNPALRLASFLGGVLSSGRDKLTLVLAPDVESMGGYIEQLLMGSLGKRKQGLVVVHAEPMGSEQAYGPDRAFYYLRLGSDRTALDERVAGLTAAGFPVANTTLPSRGALGAEVLRWQVATSLLATTLGVNPFDEADLAQTQAGSQRFLDAYARDSALPRWRASSPTEPPLLELLRAIGPGDFVAISAFFHQTEARCRTLQEVRRMLRSALGVATTLGFGAPGLYATGGWHRTGPANSVSLLLTALTESDQPVPDKLYSMSVLRDAQALAQLQLLRHHNRRVLRLHLGSDIEAGLVALRDQIRGLAG